MISAADRARFVTLASLARTTDLPAALIDLDALRHNAAILVRNAAPLPIRVASKSVRSVSVIKRVLEEFPGFVGVLAYSAREALHLVAQGLDDIVVAYPTTVGTEIAAVADACARGRRITLSVDSPEHVALHARVAESRGALLPLCLDVDSATRFPGLHFGVRRSPSADVEDCLRILAAIERSPHVELDGLLAYEAQIAGIRDRVPGKDWEQRAMRLLKRLSMYELRGRRGRIVEAIRARTPLRFVNGGGTGSLAVSRTDPSVTELAAGSGLFAPALFDGYDDLPLRPAALFALSVSRVHDVRTVVCSGGGYIASGPAGVDRLPTPVHPPGGRLIDHEGAGEVQTPVAFDDTPGCPTLGDVVLFRHAKSGELAERFTHYRLVERDRFFGDVTTYRGDGVCFF